MRIRRSYSQAKLEESRRKVKLQARAASFQEKKTDRRGQIAIEIEGKRTHWI